MYCQNCGMLKINCICGKYNKSDINRNENHEINEETKTDFSSDTVENESQVNSKQDKIQKTIKENFPFSTFLEDQLEILTEIVDAIEEGYKYIILESGVGKSAIAATLANIYKSSFILSDNEKLQEKYHEEYDLINNDKFYVSNHSDAFNEFEKLDKRKLLIVDDAHKFDENIADFFSCAIHLSDFDDELIDSFYCDVRDIENKEVDVWLDFINHLSLDDEKVNRVKYNIKENPDDWICFYDDFCDKKIVFKPLNLENILKKYLLNKAEICIFMSSTILNKEIFADELGLDISEVKFVHKDFHFSSDTNQIYLRNCADMKNFKKKVKLVSPFIEDMLEKHKKEKGIIHTDRPRYTNYIKNQIDNPRLMFHSDDDYDDKLKEFKNSSNSILVSESRVEGMAFPKDSCRFQIILKEHLLPYDKRAKVKGSNWYSYKKAIYLVQLLQRATRSEDDGCITYILDDNISKTIRKDIIDYNFIPDYILDSIADMDIEGCELISDNIRKQFGVYYLFDYDKNTKYRTGSLSKKLLNYKDYSDDSIDYKDEFDYFNNELEYQNEIINLKNNLNISHFTKEEVNQIHSSMYTSQLLIELTTKKLLKKTNRHYSLNEAEYEKLIEFTYECYDMEKTLTEFLNGKYTSKQIKQSKYYKCGQKGIRPFVEFYKIVENQIFNDFLNQIAMKIPIDEILENTQINKSQINNWYDKNKDSFIKGEHNSEFITYNKLLMEQYLTLKRKQYLNDDIKAELQINDEIISFWTDSFDMESALFKNSLNEIRMNIFLNNLNEGKSKEEALEIAEITDFEELLKDKDFENEYKTEYYENRVDRLIKSLKTMSFDKALKRAGISEDDYNRWYAAGKKQCLLKKDEDEFCLNFYINVTRVLMDRYLKLRSEGKTKTEACKKINTDLNEVKRWCNWNESGLFIDFKENNKKITAKLIIDAIKDGKSKDKIAESSDITLHELNKIIDLGLQNDRICREVYEEYESVYLSKHLEVFLKEIKNKNLKKALKNSGIEKSELDSAYNSGKNGDERFTKFYNDYLNFKISCYITQIIRGKTISKALKNSNLTDEELKDNLKEIESRILDKQMNSVIGEIAKNRTTRQAAKKARIRIDEIYRWYLEGKKGNEKFKDFADIYHELYVEVGCEIFQNFLNKGKTPKQILKIMNEDITREDYEFWIKNNLISDKNVEAKLYTEDEIKEKIENEGFRQKEEKSLSGLSIIGC